MQLLNTYKWQICTEWCQRLYHWPIPWRHGNYFSLRGDKLMTINLCCFDFLPLGLMAYPCRFCKRMNFTLCWSKAQNTALLDLQSPKSFSHLIGTIPSSAELLFSRLYELEPTINGQWRDHEIYMFMTYVTFSSLSTDMSILLLILMEIIEGQDYFWKF